MTLPLVDRLNVRADTAMPIYLQLEEQVAAMIADGTLGAGDTLPAERHLASALGLSRNTVQRVYAALRRRGLVMAHGRLGYVVQKPAAVSGINRLKGFTEEMMALGRRASSRVVESAVVTDRSIASIFGLPSETEFLHLVRERYGDGTPLAREVAWYNIEYCPSLAQADLSGSVYAHLASHGAALGHCEQSIEAAFPNAAESAVFGFTSPMPCLLIKRRSFDQKERMIEYVEGLFRGDAYTYRMTLEA
ncbi:GntR family transcriptional regulator [Ancylobacter sp. 6x-1]|uniref:GntR family transcriptional regulator n=1 Tax=Ancylobacter crimeensis TaxID=2579147 RepID=A0ABT0DB19_9HYPH|nr:GntR family transcriptional regulator [Ancylobacter crimeensis]MCK0197153.1 GntR family transcriptional regulator [Ancylobacter crimeensis]